MKRSTGPHMKDRVQAAAYGAAFMGSFVLASPVFAQSTQSDILFDLLRIPETIAVMRIEGLQNSEELAQNMFAGAPSAEWHKLIEQVYAEDRMVALVREDFTAAFADQDLSEMIAFFESDLGRTAIGLELSAREAFLDDEIENAAKEARAIALADSTPKMAQVEAFIAANDLIELNLAGALNNNLAYFYGWAEVGAQNGIGGMDEDQIISDIWSKEAEFRTDTTEWIQAYLFLAYQPLSPEQLDEYIAFYQSEVGHTLTRGTFASFDRLFNGVSYALGQASANEMLSQDL